MLINTEQDLYAACDQYQGKTITLTKSGHAVWPHLTLQSVGTRTQLNSHIPIVMQIRTDRSIYELTPPFEITEEAPVYQKELLSDETLDQLILALQELRHYRRVLQSEAVR